MLVRDEEQSYRFEPLKRPTSRPPSQITLSEREIMPSKSEVERLLNVIEAIARSPHVHDFVIGYTSQSAKNRCQQYRNVGFDHLVILADKMTSGGALDLESALDKALKARSEKGSLIFCKWHSEKRKGVPSGTW
jgi:hypothetical protein